MSRTFGAEEHRVRVRSLCGVTRLARSDQQLTASGDVAARRATVREVLSYGALDAGKTEGATGASRRPPIDALLADDLTAWKAALAAHGYRRPLTIFSCAEISAVTAHQTAT